MRIVKAKIYHLNLPMKVSFTTGFGTISSRETVIVELQTSEGLIGWGESAALSSPIYNPETTITCLHIIKDFLLPRLMDREISLSGYVEEISCIKGNKIAKFGVECALWSVKSIEENMSLSKLIGGTRQEIPVGESIGIQKSIDKTLEIIEKKLTEGYQRIKIKIRPGWDVKVLEAIRKSFPEILLMVDANSSYSLKDIKIFQKMDEYNLLMIEQPLADDDIIDHAKIQSKIKTPICLDESITGAEDVRKAIEIGACKVINVKPGRVGGLVESQKINDYAKKHNVPLWCGGMIETGIAKAFNLAAASLSEFSLPADMSPACVFFNENITVPDIKLSANGTIDVPKTSGLGFKVNKEILDKHTVSKIEINK